MYQKSVEDYQKQVIRLNRSIGQLQRHNTIWNSWANDEKIAEAKYQKNVAMFCMTVAMENAEAAESKEWLGF